MAEWSYFIIDYVPQPRFARFDADEFQETSASFWSVNSRIPSMNMAIVELTKNYAIASFKPHLNYHECHVSLVISQKTSLPLKMYKNYRDIVFCWEPSQKTSHWCISPNGSPTRWLKTWPVRSNSTGFLHGVLPADWSISSGSSRNSLEEIHLVSTQTSIKPTANLISICVKLNPWELNLLAPSHLLPLKLASKTCSKHSSTKNIFMLNASKRINCISSQLRNTVKTSAESDASARDLAREKFSKNLRMNWTSKWLKWKVERLTICWRNTTRAERTTTE